MSASEHSSQASSRASRAGRKRSDYTNGALFPMIKALSTQYPPALVAAGVAIELLQIFSMALNPHVSGHQTTWRIFYISQLPFWDSFYATGVEYSPAFVAMYWVLTCWVWITLIIIVIGLKSPHTVSTRFVKPFLRHVVNLYIGPLFIPTIQTLLTTMSCTPSPPVMANQLPNVVWLFPEQSCGEVIAQVHRGISIALCILFTLFALIVSCGNFSSDAKHTTIRKRTHPYLDFAVIIFKLGVCTAFQLFLPRGMVSYYNFVYAISAFAMAVLFGLVLPYHNKSLNRVMVVAYAVSGWASTVAYIDVKTNTVSFTTQGGFYAVLILGGLAVAAAAYYLATARFCTHTEYLFTKCVEKGFVATEENPFAVAASASDPEMLPFPKNLPMSDFVFSPHRIVEMDVIEEAIRNEDEMSGDAPVTGNESEAAAARMQKYIARVQVVSPTIDTVWLPTDAEVSTRFLHTWGDVTDTPPTPHMLSFACRIYARFLLKYPESPTTCISYVRFLTEFAPSLSRMNLSVRLLDEMGTEMLCDLYHLYQIYYLTMSVKEVLGVRDKTHERMFRRSRRLHKTTLVQTASVWRSLTEDSGNIVQLCYLTNTLSDVREECTESYLQAMNSASDDEVLFRSFANFVETVACNKECSGLCLEEADAISRRRRAKLMQRNEQNIGNAQGGQVDAPSQHSRSSISRLNRQDDDALLALRNIEGSVANQNMNLVKNLNSRTVFFSAIAMFILLVVIVGGHAGVCLGLFYNWHKQSDRTLWGGEVRSLSQEAAVQLFRLSAVLPTNNASTVDTSTISTEVNKLLAITYAYESAVNFVTYGAGKATDGDMVRFIKAPQVFLNSYSSRSAFTVDDYNYWTASNTLVQYLTRIATFARTAPIQSTFLANSDVLFVTGNVPPKYSETYLLATEQQHDVDVRLKSTMSIAFGVSLAVFALLTICTVYVFVWNFRKSASTRVMALKLFQMLAKENVKRLAEEAKGRVEKFVSGESMNNEDRGAMELDNPDLGTSMKSEGESAGFEDDDGRRTSYTSKLLAHLFQHGAVEDDDDPLPAPASEGAAAAAGGNALPVEDQPFAPVLLGTEVDEAEKDPKSASTSVRGTPVDPNKNVPTFSVGDAKAAKSGAAAGPKVEGARRRHSISLGNAVKAMSESKRHRPSILNMMESDSDVEEDITHGGVPSAQDVVEAELHGLSAASVTTDDDEIYEKNSFAALSGLTSSMVTLILAITAVIVVAVALTVQTLNDETSSNRKIATVQSEIECGDTLRQTSLYAFFLTQRFVASHDYEDYQTFIVAYKAFIVARRQCANALPSLGSIDANAFMAALNQFQNNMEISIALVVAEWSPLSSVLFQGSQWTVPIKSKILIDYYSPWVANINTEWFPYTNSTYDLSLSNASRYLLAEQTLYSDVSRASFLLFLSTQSSLATAISATYRTQIENAADLIKSHSIAALVMWVLVTILSLVFFAYWGGSSFARKVALVMAAVALISAGIGGLTYQRSQDRLHAKQAYLQERLTTAVLYENLGIQLFSAYRAVTIPTDAALYESLEASQPLVLSTNQAAIVLYSIESPNPIMSKTLEYTNEQGDVTRMLMVAAKLVLSASGSTLFDTDQRMIAIQWNRTAESKDQYLTLRFPQDDANMYSDDVTDLAKNASSKTALASRVIGTKRLSYLTSKMLNEVDQVLDEQAALRYAQSIADDDDFTSAKVGFVIVGVATIAVFAIFIIVIAAASIKSFSRTREESDLYDAIYSGYSTIIGAGLTVVAAMIIAAGIMAIVFTSMLVVDMETLNAAQKRSFYAANAMSYAESMLVSTSLNTLVLNRIALRATIDGQTNVNTDAYFSTSSGFSSRKDQNVAIFGPESQFVVRDTRTSILTTATSAVCYNPANAVNGNQQSVSILYTKFFNLMREIAYLDAAFYASTTNTLAVAVLTPLLEEARGQYDTLIYVLKTSDSTYHDKIKSTISTYFNAILAVLIVAVAIVVLVMITTVFPIIDRVMRHEAGTKLLLTLLPDDVLTTCPEITDFYDANAGTKDDQIKKKLQQSEKLLQNILPPVISRRLKNGESVIADTHPNVTVVFAALIGFDEYSAKMEAKQIVHFLNSLIVTFDQITDLLDLEKIKTIGDIYFLCGGLTKKTESDHPLRCMECALLFLEAMQENNARHNTPNLTQRIGVNTDPAVAGVIGSKKIAYDLWGDSVNTASRMQSTGLPGKIQVSDKTYHLIKEYFSFTERKVAAKGKGELTTHLFANRTKPTPYRNLNWRVSTR